MPRFFYLVLQEYISTDRIIRIQILSKVRTRSRDSTVFYTVFNTDQILSWNLQLNSRACQVLLSKRVAPARRWFIMLNKMIRRRKVVVPTGGSGRFNQLFERAVSQWKAELAISP